MPFELEPAEHSYFFDCGIIARGLVAAWRATGEQDFLDIASAVGNGMLADFAAADGSYYPVIRLPKKEPIPRDPLRWSQSPGCYQLKAALGWYELFEATGETGFLHAYYGLCESALREYGTFLPGHSDPAKIVDRLHAFLYFLEGLLPRAEESSARAALGEGIRQVAAYADELRPHLERSDVYAQLLRLRIFADGLGAVRLDRAAAQHEAVTLVEFQAESQDPRVDGGFYFGRKAGEFLPYISPVSTAFALQALALYCGDATPDWHQLV